MAHFQHIAERVPIQRLLIALQHQPELFGQHPHRTTTPGNRCRRGGCVAANRAANKAADANEKAIDANAYQGQIATVQFDDYKNTYRPLEHNLASEVKSYDTPQAYQRAAGDAQARVAQQFGLAQQRLTIHLNVITSYLWLCQI